jgi:nitrate/nitrite-specific signal transduction histidine kinase
VTADHPFHQRSCSRAPSDRAGRDLPSGYEAIRNACLHSRANGIDVALEYGRDLTLRVSDNGVGIDTAVIATGKEGHFGLRGMRERAERIGAKFTLVSGPGKGTAITLIVPGRTAFWSAATAGT